MAPFPAVTIHRFGSKTSENLNSYSYSYVLEGRAEDAFSSRAPQQVSLASVDLLPRITTTEFRRPTHTAGTSWHNAHEPHTLKHLSIWAYLAFGFIVLWVSFVMVYACFRCCRANIVRLDTGNDEALQVWRERSVAASKGRRRPKKWGREISVASSKIEFLRKGSINVKVSDTGLKGERSWTGDANSQKMTSGHGRSILVGSLPPSPGLGTMNTGLHATDLKSSFMGALGMGSEDDPGKAASVDLFNIPFALQGGSRLMSELWREPKLSPVRGSIIRPKPAVTVASRRW